MNNLETAAIATPYPGVIKTDQGFESLDLGEAVQIEFSAHCLLKRRRTLQPSHVRPRRSSVFFRF